MKLTACCVFHNFPSRWSVSRWIVLSVSRFMTTSLLSNFSSFFFLFYFLVSFISLTCGRDQFSVYLFHADMTLFIDGAHTVESLANCSAWFKKASLRERPAATKLMENGEEMQIRRVLLFNLTGNNRQCLHLMSKDRTFFSVRARRSICFVRPTIAGVSN